ncbi:MAG: hypothetical protein ACT4P3_16220 [Betaproteobacteria bacterium]
MKRSLPEPRRLVSRYKILTGASQASVACLEREIVHAYPWLHGVAWRWGLGEASVGWDWRLYDKAQEIAHGRRWARRSRGFGLC